MDSGIITENQIINCILTLIPYLCNKDGTLETVVILQISNHVHVSF